MSEENVSLEMSSSEYRLLTLFTAVDDESPDLWIRKCLFEVYERRLESILGKERKPYWKAMMREVKKELES